jgi:hypothetical protein
MIKLKAVVIADEGSGDDRLKIYLGPAFRYGTRDVRDLIVACDPEQAINMRDVQRRTQDRQSAPELGFPWAMYLTARVPVVDGSGNLATTGDLFFDIFNLLGRIDSRKQFRDLSCCVQSRLNVEVESIEQLRAFMEMVSTPSPLSVASRQSCRCQRYDSSRMLLGLGLSIPGLPCVSRA